MMRILKLVGGMIALIAFVWVGANVPLGSRTLFQHLQAIGRTRETGALLEGARKAAQPVVDGVKKRWNSSGSSAVDPAEPPVVRRPAAPPDDKISDADRLRLRKVLEPHHASR